MVEHGALSAVHDSWDGRRVRLGDFRPPCAVDKVALLDSRSRTATWEAIGPTRIRSVPRATVAASVRIVPATAVTSSTKVLADVRSS